MSIDVEKIKQIREETGAGVMDVKQVLEEFNGDVEKAKAELMKKGLAKAAKKSDREASDGLIYSYIHAGGKVGSMIHLACETDFVAKTDDFQNLCKEIAMQVCTEESQDVENLLKAEYMRDSSKTISDLIAETIAKLGENIELRNAVRFSIRD